MKLTEISFVVIAHVGFTKAEVRLLEQCSSTHYDHKCKAASKSGGIIFGVKNYIRFSVGSVPLNVGDVDLLLKICEMPPKGVEINPLYYKMYEIFREMAANVPEAKKY